MLYNTKYKHYKIVLSIIMRSHKPNPKAKLKPFGYLPDPQLARQLIHDLVEELNGPPIYYFPSGQPHKRRKKTLPPTAVQQELRRLVEDWKKSGLNLKKLFAGNSELRNWTMTGMMRLWPTSEARGYLEWSAEPLSNPSSSSRDQALHLFMGLISNPLWELLGGPCHRCGGYFVKKTRRQKAIYCSRYCGAAATAIVSVRAERKRVREEKIARAQREIERLSSEDLSGNWKSEVARKTGYSRKWITRSINNGSLQSRPVVLCSSPPKKQ